ncbi:unnamed protein product [Litomosoides sigmodontis]|uniref:Uncharacterized protein n=1 Tax=Litomosoides sigmodontis TaxID=42156 RepID=A0A3P6TWQ1_LITSI|nr:unnamed protein product [Litomosoides sigmodontis]
MCSNFDEIVYFGEREEGRKRFEQLFDKYCILFMKRLEQQKIGVLVRVKILLVFEFIEIDDLECSLDYSKWLEEFMTPFLREKDGIYREVRQHDFKQRIILIREAVLNRDWSKVGAFLGQLPSFRQNLKDVPEAFRKKLGGSLDKTCRMLFPYALTIFRAGVERFMQYDIPHDMITKSAAELMLVLIATERKYSNVRFDVENNSLLYITELLIYAIANGQKQEMQDFITAISSLPSVAQKHKYITILRAYKVLSRYEHWRLGEDNIAQSSSFNLGDEIIAVLLDVESGQQSVFISVAVHYLHCVGKVDVLMDALEECCRKTPFMLVDCYRALLLNNMPDKASSLLDAILPQCSFVSHPILLDWLKPRLLNPHDFDLPEEMLCHICKILFVFLDYGANRTNDYAWMFLWAAVQHVKDDNLLRLEWDPRESWWPKFHNVELSEGGTDCRRRVFTRLYNLSV